MERLPELDRMVKHLSNCLAVQSYACLSMSVTITVDDEHFIK